MNKHIIFTLISLLTMASLCFAQATNKNTSKVSKPAVLDKTIIDQEIAAWEAVKTKQLDAFRKAHASNFLSVSSGGVVDLEQMAKGVQDVELKSYSLADTKVIFPKKNTAILTYKVTVQGSYKGTDISGAYYASSVWVKQSGQWLAFLYNEIKAE